MGRYTLGVLLWVMLRVGAALSQQTTAFTYQGQLTDAGQTANGSFDLQFALFGDTSGGAQIGTTQTVATVPVSGGVFTVQLDFGTSAFPGANRFLEIGVRPAGGGSYTTLAPRQQISSAPYAIRTLSAATADALSSACVGCIQDTHIQSVAGSKVSGTIATASIPAGSGSYVQNTTTQQANSNFNISGNGTIGGNLTVAGILNAPVSGNYIQNTTSPQLDSTFNISGDGTAGGTLSGEIVNASKQFNLGGSHILSTAGIDNLFAGEGAGQSNTTGGFSTFLGKSAGRNNTTGYINTFVGAGAGEVNTTGNHNTFVGQGAGALNITGDADTFIGQNAGALNDAGYFNTFVGVAAGARNTTGYRNAFVGTSAGFTNITGSRNTLIGIGADVGSDNLTNATAIGANARVHQSNSMVLGSIAGVNGAAASVNVGIGTTTPQAILDVNGSFLARAGATIVGTNGDGAVVTARRSGGDSFVIIDSTPVSQNSVLAYRKNNFNRWLMYADNSSEIGGNAGSDFKLDRYNDAGNGIATALSVSRSTGNVIINGRGEFGGLLKLNQIDSGFGAGTVQLCRNAANVIATCTSSSLRYKRQVAPFTEGVTLIRRLRPISFTWKMDGSRDVGLGAEDVAKIEPLLVTHNDKGEVEGVRYDRLNVVLVNAIREQQNQIETLWAANAALNARLRALEEGRGNTSGGMNDFGLCN